MAETVGPRLRRTVTTRARGRCEYGLSPADYAPERFSIEHIVPRALGGLTVLANLALAGQGCNNYQATKITALEPGTNTQTALFPPRQDAWAEHFAGSEDGLQIIGLTSMGRATVRLLRLKRVP